MDVEVARAIAIRHARAPLGSATAGGLEIEDGCVVFAFDITLPDQVGPREVVLDAGNGRLLCLMHESIAAEEAEQREKTITESSPRSLCR